MQARWWMKPVEWTLAGAEHLRIFSSVRWLLFWCSILRHPYMVKAERECEAEGSYHSQRFITINTRGNRGTSGKGKYVRSAKITTKHSDASTQMPLVRSKYSKPEFVLQLYFKTSVWTTATTDTTTANFFSFLSLLLEITCKFFIIFFSPCVVSVCYPSASIMSRLRATTLPTFLQILCKTWAAMYFFSYRKSFV